MAGDLADELRAALEDAAVGEPWSPHLLGRLETAARAVLHRRGLRGARVHARRAGSGVEVVVLLPAGPARVERVVVHLGTAG